MAPYDSDSSGGEEEDFTETNVLLGYASKEAGDDTISYLGGRPTWIDPTTPPSAALAKCKVCNDHMVLLLQLNGELPEHFPNHERRLYVLTCRRKTCRRKEGSLRALRGVRISEDRKEKSKKIEQKAEPTPPKPAINLGESLFGVKGGSGASAVNPFASSANPFSSSSNPFSTSSNPFAAAGLGSASELSAKSPQVPSSSTAKPTATNLPQTFASALSLNNPTPTFGPPPPPEPWPSEAELPPAYPTLYFVDTDYETLDKIEDLPIPVQTMDLDDGGSGSGGSQKEDKDVYESTIDTTFQKFADRLAQNPEQVIRYEFAGQPLLYSKKDVVGKLLAAAKDHSSANAKVRTSSGSGSGMPKCANCGAGRVFEVQLTPHVIMELESEESGLDGMEWGTIIVGVCEKDCGQKGVEVGAVGYVEEWAGVQWEEVGERK